MFSHLKNCPSACVGCHCLSYVPLFVPVYPAQIPFLLLLVMFDAQATNCSLRCILWIPPFPPPPFYTPVFYMIFFQWSLRRYQLRLQFNALRLGDNIQHQCLRFQFVYKYTILVGKVCSASRHLEEYDALFSPIDRQWSF